MAKSLCAENTTGVMFTAEGKAGKEGEQPFQLGGGAAANQGGSFRVFIPGLGYVAVSGQQAVGNHKAGARDTNPENRVAAGKADLVDPENVADGVAIPVQDHGWHGLFLLQLLDLAGQLLHLLLQIIGRRRGIVMRQKAGPDQQGNP